MMKHPILSLMLAGVLIVVLVAISENPSPPATPLAKTKSTATPGPSKEDLLRERIQKAASAEEFKRLEGECSGALRDELDRRRRRWYIDTHPNLPQMTRALIGTGWTEIGMSMDECWASMGLPERQATIGIFDVWRYPYPARVLVFRNGLLDHTLDP